MLRKRGNYARNPGRYNDVSSFSASLLVLKVLTSDVLESETNIPLVHVAMFLSTKVQQMVVCGNKRRETTDLSVYI